MNLMSNLMSFCVKLLLHNIHIFWDPSVCSLCLSTATNETIPASACRWVHSCFSSGVHIQVLHCNTLFRGTRHVNLEQSNRWWSVALHCPATWKISSQAATSNNFPQIERPRGTSGSGVIWRLRSPSWPSMRDEALYMSSLPLWIEPKLHHHSNGFFSLHPERHGHSTDCLKEGDCACAAADSEALKPCVFVPVQLWSGVPACVASICPHEL